MYKSHCSKGAKTIFWVEKRNIREMAHDIAPEQKLKKVQKGKGKTLQM